MNRYRVGLLEHAEVPEAEAFLLRSAQFCLFLLGNLRDVGTRLTDHPNSANFRCLRDLKTDEIVQIFALTRRGNLLLSPGPAHDSEALDWILEEVQNEAPDVRPAGCIGEWRAARAAWLAMAEAGLVRKEAKFLSQETLYELYPLLASVDDAQAARPLSNADAQEWIELRRAFDREEGMPNSLTDEKLLELFQKNIRLGRAWGADVDGRLAAIANLNAVFERMGQVGGVFCREELRGRGLGRAVMRRLLSDSATKLGLDRMILFTGRGNMAARALYEKLGFREIGEFALILDEALPGPPEKKTEKKDKGLL